MAQGNPQPGEQYLHFKDRMYEVIAIAYHSETMEKYVVYKALYDDGKTYVRPYEMFVSEVDHEKYPLVTQKYRFQYVGPDEDAGKEETDEADGEEQAASPWLDRLLDAETPEQRYDVVCTIKGEINDELIDDIATVLDLSIPEGDLNDRYEQLKYCMRTIQKYESGRLR
ncbi:MAG: DUF1653 domain-containing protein [Lachnospiraceae bacterium]|nr:DUF1653 domain-containing protein [Clostridiales bacterium]MCC8141839.1 DUF1653 domain-containing protein [Lachnospiraceae bacterium]